MLRALAEARELAGRHEREAALDLGIRSGEINPLQATSLMNDNHYAFDICNNLLQMARVLFSEEPKALQEAASRLSLEDSDLDELLASKPDKSPSNDKQRDVQYEIDQSQRKEGQGIMDQHRQSCNSARQKLFRY